MKNTTLLLLSILILNSARAQEHTFNAEEIALISSGDTNDLMRVLKINQAKDSVVLRTNCLPIDPTDSLIPLLIKRMYVTVTDKNSMGVGIAAPQLGVLKRIVLVQRLDKPGLPFEAYINPVIMQYSRKKQVCMEGCLSIPNRMDTLNSRAYAILIEYDTPEGEHKIEMVEAFTAVVFQHEIDHLNGILYTDHLALESAQAGIKD